MPRFSPFEPADHGTEPHDEPIEAVLLLDRDEDQPKVTTESAVATNRGTGVVGVLALVAAAAVIFALFIGNSTGNESSSGSGDAAGATGGSSDQLGELSPDGGPETGADVGARGFVAWPDPPVDHDPHISGRPGIQEPVRETLVGQTLVYVNDKGRPTVIDLSTGDQQELDVAGPRTRDQFFIERGQVVSNGGTDTDLPASGGRAFVFSVHRTAGPGDQPIDEQDMLPAMSGPSLCLDEGGCSEVPFVAGTFGGSDDQATVIENAGGPVETVADVLGAGWWARDGRWTVFALGADASQTEIRLPTPMRSTVVWLISQTPS